MMHVKLEWRQYLVKITYCYHYGLLIHLFLKNQRVLKMMDSNLQVMIERRVNAVGVNTNNELPFDPEMPALEDISTFNFSSDYEDDDEMADMNNLDTTIQVSPTPTTRIHKDHPIDHIKEEVYVCQPPGFEDHDSPDKV
nr:hypothetical protein [Tanacetum cinerariifolium]